MFAQLERSLGLRVGAIALAAAAAAVVVAQLHKSLVKIFHGVSRDISAVINSRAECSNDSDKPPEST